MAKNRPKVEILDDTATLYHAAAERIIHIAREALDARGHFHLALAGGSTPQGLYELLATPDYIGRVEWARTSVYFGDERCVPPDDTRSNYRMAREALLDHVPIPPVQVHRMAGEAPPRQAATDYGRLLQGQLPHDSEGRLRFDLVLLGMGSDGHTASLFPKTDILKKRKAPVAAVFVPQVEMWRLSLTFPTLNNARHLLLLAAGPRKADIIRHLLNEHPDAQPLPLQMVRPRGTWEWLLDRAAARHVKQPEPA